MNKRKICTVLTDRANYGRIWPVMKSIQEHSELELITVCSGTMLLERFGQVEYIVEADGFKVDGRIYMELEGSVPSTMAKSVGFGIVEFSSEFQRINPDILLIIGDRYETLAAAIAAAYQNIPIAHIQGGEVSGSIDESARHAITKFAQYHFPATQRSAEFIIRMGENPEYVFNYGCPTGDYVIPLNTELPSNMFLKGIGVKISLNAPFFLVMNHPVTTNFGEETQEVEELIKSLEKFALPTIWLWPNIDAGSDHISSVLRKYREKRSNHWLRFEKNFEPQIFQKILKKCVCAIGNSSSFVRDSTFSGTPVVLVGTRQNGREYGENLIKVDYIEKDITEAIRKQLKTGKYPSSSLYGEGNTSTKITNKLAKINLYTQKHLHYTNTDDHRIQ